MPFNKDKRIRLKDFLAQVEDRLMAQNHPQALIFFQVYVKQSLAADLVRCTNALPDIAELELAPGDFDVIYPFAAHKLIDAASRCFSEVHPDAYDDANAVSKAFREELNEFFECSGEDGLFDFIPIKSLLSMMA